MLRVFKVSRHFAGTKILASTFQQSMRALRAPFVFLFVSVTIFAALMYFLESGQWNDEAGAYLMEDGQPPTFTSILDAAYFVVVTMTTVGYGDQSPSTSLGKGLAIAMMLFGVLFTAMPLTIVGNEFYDAIEKEGGFQYLLDAESLDDKSEAKVITFERVSHEYVAQRVSARTHVPDASLLLLLLLLCCVGCRFVLVGAAVTRLNRYVDRVTHDPTNLTATDYENEKHVLSLMREWVKRHVKFMCVPCGAHVLVAGCVDAAPSDCTQVHAARAYHTQLPRQGQVPGVEKPGEAARVQPQLLQVRGRGCTGRCS